MDGNLGSGQTAAVGKAGLAIGSTPAEISIAAPNGAGLDYVINGICYHKADAASEAITAAEAQLADTTCHYTIGLNSSGTVSSVKGKEVATADIGVVGGSIQYPRMGEDICPIGATKVVTDGVTFTAATTAHDAADVTTTYEDFALGMPNSPTSS